MVIRLFIIIILIKIKFNRKWTLIFNRKNNLFRYKVKNNYFKIIMKEK